MFKLSIWVQIATYVYIQFLRYMNVWNIKIYLHMSNPLLRTCTWSDVNMLLLRYKYKV